MGFLVWIWLLAGVCFFLLAFLKDKPSTKRIFKILAFVFVVSLPFAATNWIAAFNMAMLYSILAIGLNLLLGNAGQISLGHAGFYALGAYATAFLRVYAHFPIVPAILVGAIIIALVAMIIGTPILRLKGHFLGIATLGLHIVIEHMIKDELKHYFEGASIKLKFQLGFFTENFRFSLRDMLSGWDFSMLNGGEKPFLYDFVKSVADNTSVILVFFFTLIVLVLIVYMIRNILRTRVGRALGALRDSEIAARALGVNIALFKNIAFALSAFIAALAGGIYALSLGTLDEASFALTISLICLAMIVIGGLGSIQGAIIGATLYQLLDFKVIQMLSKQFNLSSSLSPALLGLAVVLMIIFAPKGIVYMLYQLKLKISQKRSS